MHFLFCYSRWEGVWRPAYNAVLKWKPKSELSRVSNSAQIQHMADTPEYNYITNSKNVIHILNNSIYYMNIFKILPSFKICNGFVMTDLEPVQHICHDNFAWTHTCQKWPSPASLAGCHISPKLNFINIEVTYTKFIPESGND